MIPIIFENTETAFNNNGICRLRDCLSCVVTEERNGIYECDFSYPATGANYEEIKCGRYIGVTHGEAEDIQPFEIVSISRPISGVVSFHAVHLSYRQSQMVVYGSGINSLSDAFALLKTATPENPFEYETDMASTAYMAAADGTPRSVRKMLGGVRGSILDTYGGEYEWDKWTVKLHSARGEMKDFAIRYGVNLLDYTDDMSYQGTFTSCIAYWTSPDGDKVIATASLGKTGYNGRDNYSVLDLTEKFEEKPTETALQSAALSYMLQNNTNLPAQSIKVDFVRLAEMGEFSAFQDLLKCNLCDTIKVIFPLYDISAAFKIVRTEWDVLPGAYSAMELGNLATTLAEALGMVGSSSSGGGVVGADYIVDQGTSGIWTYRKWRTGVAECWTTQTYTTAKATTEWGNVHYSVLTSILTFPSDFFMETPEVLAYIRSENGRFWVTHANDATKTNVGTIYNLAPQKYESNSTAKLSIYAKGTWDASSWDGGGGGSTPITVVTDYNTLVNKPQLEGVTLQGNKTLNEDGIHEYLSNLEIETLLQNADL